jgi:ADP-heptose:LPS heptosyltransferase
VKIFLKHTKSPGDILMLTAAVRDLHLAYPDKYITNVQSSAMDIWKHNPYITNFKESEADLIIDSQYKLINKSNNNAHHFIHAFHQDLEDYLNIRIPVTKGHGDIHLSADEKRWMSQIKEMGINDNFWIISAGGKFDFTSKYWNPEKWQEVVDHFKGKITFAQTGLNNHFHPPLQNVIDLRGKTNLRQYIRLFYHSVGVLSTITCAMHFAAAVPSKFPLRNRPCVVVATGMEPPTWEKYSTHKYITRAGTMPCCINGGCWRKYCAVSENAEPMESKHCLHKVSYPIPNGYEDKFKEFSIPKCMDDIKSSEVIAAIEEYYNNNLLKYNNTSIIN